MSLTDTALPACDAALGDVFPVATPVTHIACLRDVCTVRLTPKYGSGATVAASVHFTWHGAVGAPTVIVQGGISATRDVARDGERPGWWEEFVRAHGPVDLARVRVLSIDWLSAADLGGDVAGVSSEDQADALAALLDALGIRRAQAFIGASYGAMVGLAFAARHAHRLGRLVAISGAHRAHPLATAVRAIQREIVRAGLRSGVTVPALSLARQLAMTTYRGAEEFAERFDAEPEFRDGRFRFPVEDYLAHAGEKFVARFDADRYLALSESIDLHRIDPAEVRVPALLIAIDSDRLVPVEDFRDLAARLPHPVVLHEIPSRYGHDAFLKEFARIGALIQPALAC